MWQIAGVVLEKKKRKRKTKQEKSVKLALQDRVWSHSGADLDLQNPQSRTRRVGKNYTVGTWRKTVQKINANRAWSAVGIICKTNVCVCVCVNFAECSFFADQGTSIIKAPLKRVQSQLSFCRVRDSCCLSWNHRLNEPLNSSLIPHVKARVPAVPPSGPASPRSQPSPALLSSMTHGKLRLIN